MRGEGQLNLREEPAAIPRSRISALWRDARGQALSEHALLLAALFGGAAAFSWPYTRRLLEALARHFEAIRLVLESPFP